VGSLVGQTLGRYHILEQLGEGGMAIVYKAYDTRLETDVAVKVIRTDYLAPALLERALKRFEREAKALARLTHPNIVKVTDYGEHEGKPFLVMPYLPGGTLKERLKPGPLAWWEAVQILLPIARALQYTHAQNILHRDVKPSNILLTESGQPMLTDFGVAKLFDMKETTELTGTGMGVGTPEYMAPEQWTGHVTLQTDIYALGVVFYELVTGRKPYMADTPAALLLKQARDPLPRPRTFVAGLPDSVEKVLFKALARNAEERYLEMVAFADALEQLLVQKPGTLSYPGKFTKDKTAVQSLDLELPTRDDEVVPAPRRFSIRWAGGFVIVIILIAILAVQYPRLNAAYFPTSTPTFTKTPTSTPTQTVTLTPSATLTHTSTPQPTSTRILPTKTPGTSYKILKPLSPMDLNVMSIENCTINVNGVLNTVAGPWNWNWGDGSSTRGWFPQSHTFAGSGAYLITVSSSSGVENSISLDLVCRP
jgi:serine/threonine protein kinase